MDREDTAFRAHPRLAVAALTLLAATLLFAAPRAAAAPPDGAAAIEVTRTEQLNDRLTEYGLTTPALAGETNLRVLLPKGYDAQPNRQYPVLYLLHGCCDAEDGSKAWTDSGMAQELTAGLPLIVVMPAGGRGGFYSDWFNGGDFGPPQYETYHVGELIPWVDENFRTRARREGRVIAGLSMGGFGSMSYAARHPDMFVGAAAFSGAVDNTDPVIGDAIDQLSLLDGAEPSAVWGPSATERIRRRAHNPVDLAPNLQGLRLVMRTGNGEPGGEFGGGPDALEAGVHGCMVTLHETLAELGFRHTWDDYGPGAHTWPYWAQDLERTLPQFMKTLADPPAPPREVDFRAVERRYEAYGWRVALEREVLEFSRLYKARKRGFRLSGSGVARVTTPAKYRPGSLHSISIVTASDGMSSSDDAVERATDDGRLRIKVPLGPSNTVQEDAPGAQTQIYEARVRIANRQARG